MNGIGSQDGGVEFEAGFGRAGYPSRHDGGRFVDTSLSLDGVYSDEDVDSLLLEGRIHLYRNAPDGRPVSLSRLPSDAAGAVFAMGAMHQVDILAAPPEKANLDVGRMRHVVARDIVVPEWLRGMTRFVGQAMHHDDFEAMGALYALSRLASGEGVDREVARDAGIELHRLASAVEMSMGRWAEARSQGNAPA